MKKYATEGNIDFYAELFKSLEEPEEPEQKDSTCLISGEPLKEPIVQLECGHRFNYYPLFVDIRNHKKKFNSYETLKSYVNSNQIRCPYCRNIQNKLLPYIKDIGVPMWPGVNIDKIPFDASRFAGKCCYEVHNSKGSNFQCGVVGYPINYCVATHRTVGDEAYVLQGETYGDTNMYCPYHQKIMKMVYRRKAYEKAKAEKEAEKLKRQAEKEEKLAAKKKEKEEKLAAKQKAKEEKEQSKKKKTPLQNVVLGNSQVSSGCTVLRKSGLNVGIACGAPLFQGQLCKRHHTLAQQGEEAAAVEKDPTLYCQSVLKSGKRKGEPCGVKLVCKRHCPSQDSV